MNINPLQNPTTDSLMKVVNQNVKILSERLTGIDRSTYKEDVDWDFVRGQIYAYQVIAKLLSRELILDVLNTQEEVKA